MYFFVIILSMPVAGLLGARAALLAQIAIVIALIAIFQKAPASRDLDSILLSMPAFGPIYERWFRKDSYFRQDARLVYLKVVPEIVRKVAEDMTATKGVKLIQQYQRAPILGELYKLDPSARERLALKFN